MSDDSDSDLHCVATFTDKYGPESQAFQDDAKNTSYAIGDGLVGKTWANSAPQWLDKVHTHKDGPSDHFQNGLCVPVIVDDDVQAVLSFYATDPHWPKPSTMDDFASLPGPLVNTTLTSGEVRPKLVERAWSKGEHAGVGHRTQEQMDAVFDDIVESGVFTAAAVYEDVSYFYNDLGLPADYFDRYEVHEIAQHVTAYMSAKKLAASADPRTGRDSKQEEVSARVITEKGLCIMVPSHYENIMRVESEIDRLRSAMDEHQGMAVARYRSESSAVPYGDLKLMMYVVDIEDYVQSPKQLRADGGKGMLERDIEKVATPGFLRIEKLREPYQKYINDKQEQLRTYVNVSDEVRDDNTRHVVIGTRSTTDGRTSTRGMNELISECIGPHINAHRKYMTTFSNGLIFHSLYLDGDVPKKDIDDMVARINLLTMVPRESCMSTLSLLTKKDESQGLTPEAFAYSVCASNFAFYFLQSENADLETLKADLKQKDPESVERLHRIAAILQQKAVPNSRIDECINSYPSIVADLYNDFEKTFSPEVNTDREKPKADEAISERIRKEVVDEVDRDILKMFATFNKSVVKTNFYSQRKSTLAFRVEPKEFFTGLSQFEETPYGLFMIMSNDFRGFHVRFQPVARGGLRLIQSKDADAVYNNRLGLFNENYNLALTQNKKNKDIPEFGSKGTILLEPSNQSEDAGRYAFHKYISGMMDVLLPHITQKGEKPMLDFHKEEEILFFGPDEGTAPYMDSAAFYAKDRQYRYWTSSTTGKPPSMGGIPHDTYGMTTRSVRQFVWGALEKAGIDRTKVKKVQTGGPDGDLGSNEIILSEDVTMVMSDKSGVIFDPEGLDREELMRLAVNRDTIAEFDQSKLSSGGMYVSADATNVTLPDGTFVENGTKFQDEFLFHPLAKAQLFVPCGGRPGVINMKNVHRLIGDKIEDHQFQIIVEGANLFITEDARAVLEDAGVILYKDASTNKGGVTSSSLEVLASLCMNDDEHKSLMQTEVKEKANARAVTTSPFYDKYVDEIIDIVEENARLEFEAVHKYAEATGMHRCKTTDKLSDDINTLNTACQNSELWNNDKVRHKVLSRAIPKALQDELGLDTIIERLPDPYLKAVFGYYIASRFVYERGMEIEGFDYLTAFYEHMASFSGSD